MISRYDYLFLKSFVGIIFLIMYVYYKEMVILFQIMVYCNFDYQQIILKILVIGVGVFNIFEFDV